MKTLLQVLSDKKHKEIISIAPNRPVFDALVILAEYKIGALAVMEGDKLVGIFSERDYARARWFCKAAHLKPRKYTR